MVWWTWIRAGVAIASASLVLSEIFKIELGEVVFLCDASRTRDFGHFKLCLDYSLMSHHLRVPVIHRTVCDLGSGPHCELCCQSSFKVVGSPFVLLDWGLLLHWCRLLLLLVAVVKHWDFQFAWLSRSLFWGLLLLGSLAKEFGRVNYFPSSCGLHTLFTGTRSSFLRLEGELLPQVRCLVRLVDCRSRRAHRFDRRWGRARHWLSRGCCGRSRYSWSWLGWLGSWRKFWVTDHGEGLLFRYWRVVKRLCGS